MRHGGKKAVVGLYCMDEESISNKKNCHFIALKFFKPGNIYFTCYYKLWSIIFQFVFLLTFLCL